jgi:hypothetical protein
MFQRPVSLRNPTPRTRGCVSNPDGLYWGVDNAGNNDAVWILDLWFDRRRMTAQKVLRAVVPTQVDLRWGGAHYLRHASVSRRCDTVAKDGPDIANNAAGRRRDAE